MIPKYESKEYWSKENLNYIEPHYRLVKVARVANSLSLGRQSDLLDVGCGPATLAKHLNKNIHYYGIDIAIQSPNPNLKETDLVLNEIIFKGMLFDIVVAQGFFEYMGNVQNEKFSEIRKILKEEGIFIATYVNFDHFRKRIWPNYNNVQSIKSFSGNLKIYFNIDRYFPTSYSRQGTELRRKFFAQIQTRLRFNIPVIGPRLAVEYIFICSPK